MSEDRPQPRTSLATVALAAGCVAALAFAYRDLLTIGRRYTVESGVEYWLMAPNDRAPLLVLALAAWLAYRRYLRLSELPARPGPTWLVGLLLALATAILAWSIYVSAADLSALSLIAASAAVLVRGWGLAGLRAMWLPLAFLIFVIPIPAPLLGQVLWQLRLLTADYTGWLLYLMGLPALVSGDQILRPDQAFQVIEGCSGLRSMETLTMLAVLLIDSFRRRGWHAMVLALAAPVVALALNGVRVLTLVLNPHSEIVAIHSLQGIAILLLGLLVLYGLDGLLVQLRRRYEAGARPAAGGRPGSSLPAGPTLRFALVVALGLLVVRLATPVWNAPRPPRALVAGMDQHLAGYDWEPIPHDNYFSGSVIFRESISRRYARARSHPIDVFIGSADLRDRRTSILSPTNSRPGSGWMVRASREVQLSPEGPELQELVVQKGFRRRATYTWYLGVRSLGEETLRNFLGLERSPFHRSETALVARLSIPVTDAPTPGQQRALETFYEELAPLLESMRSGAPAAVSQEPSRS